MKPLGEIEIKQALRYSETHEWVKENGNIRVGIDDYAQSALGDIVYAELPSVGDSVTAGTVCGSLESTKAVSDINSPVTGKITAVNEMLADSPELINSSPYDEGWIFEVKITDQDSLAGLMDAGAYAEFLRTQVHGG